MKVNRKLGIEYGVACIGTKLFDFSEDGESSVSVFVKCLFSFERGSLYEWQDFIVRQKITTCTIFCMFTSHRIRHYGQEVSLLDCPWFRQLGSEGLTVTLK